MFTVFYGSVIAGWQHIRKFVEPGEHTIEVPAPSDSFRGAILSGWPDMLYDPRMVRLVSTVGHWRYVKAEGDIEPPARDMGAPEDDVVLRLVDNSRQSLGAPGEQLCRQGRGELRDGLPQLRIRGQLPG